MRVFFVAIYTYDWYSSHVETLATILLYGVLFFAVYVQVFLLVTYIDTRKTLPRRTGDIKLETYPSVSILVPCYNEQDTIKKTVESLLALRYPHDKVEIVLIDDGSTDATLDHMRTFAHDERVRILHQTNAGKHEALNYGLRMSESDVVTTLDADSFVSPYALQRVVHMLNTQRRIYAVVSSILIQDPKTWVQYAQKAEYEMSIYVKNMLARINGLHVTPGPFSAFRREIFDKVGMYKQAHNTEDCEIALRIQQAGYAVGYCTDSYVYTVGPSTVVSLFKQRVRWIYGFLRNLLDYREMLFDRRYAGLAFFTLPTAIISFVTVLVTVSFIIYHVVRAIIALVQYISAVGFSPDAITTPSAFSIPLSASVLVMIALYVLVAVSILIGRRLGRQRLASIKDVILFIILTATVAPLFIMKSMADAVRTKQSRWK